MKGMRLFSAIGTLPAPKASSTMASARPAARGIRRSASIPGVTRMASTLSEKSRWTRKSPAGRRMASVRRVTLRPTSARVGKLGEAKASNSWMLTFFARLPR
ncbi:hypothetical protein D3C87_1689730 [compost metagenome]